MNTIVCGDLALTADVSGERIGLVRDHLQTPLSIHRSATAFLNGQVAQDDDVIPPDAELEFLKVWGKKGVGRVWTPTTFCEQFACSHEDLERWVSEGLRVLELADGDIRITETAVDDFLRNGGSISSPAPNGTEDKPPTRTGTKNEQVSDLTPILAAREIGCSRSQVYKLMRAGELAYRRVGRAYRISRESVADFKTRNSAPSHPPAPPPTGGYKFKHI